MTVFGGRPTLLGHRGLGRDTVDGHPENSLGSILAAQANVRTIADQAVDAPYRDEYCCATVVSGKFAANNPAGAAKVTRALLKGAMWVDRNPTAAL